MTKLTIENLHLKYGDADILKGISLQLREGEILVLLGPSGSGKTTLLRTIAGLERPSAGRIRIGDAVVFAGDGSSEVPAERRNLGVVFQSYALWPHRNIAENVSYGLKLRKVPQAERTQRTTAALEQLGLAQLGTRYPHQLSGGQQQRVAVARALVYSPPVILMDEPLSNLDAKLRDEAKAWLRGLIRERKLSAIIVTHDQSEALAMADRIALLSDGHLVQEGSPQEIYQAPKSLVTAEFFGSNNVLTGTAQELRDGHVRLAGPGWEIWGQASDAIGVGDRATAVIRIEQVRLATIGQENALELPLVTSMFAGERWQHAFRIGESIFRAYGPRQLGDGKYSLSVPRDGVWVFGNAGTRS